MFDFISSKVIKCTIQTDCSRTEEDVSADLFRRVVIDETINDLLNVVVDKAVANLSKLSTKAIAKLVGSSDNVLCLHVEDLLKLSHEKLANVAGDALGLPEIQKFANH